MSQIKLSNSSRNRKVQTRRMPQKRRDTPFRNYKCLSEIQKPRFIEKMGYQYQTGNKVLREMQVSFQSKCDLYFSKIRAINLSSRQKRQLKQRIGFRTQQNPIISIFKKLSNKYVRPLLLEGFQSIAEVESD